VKKLPPSWTHDTDARCVAVFTRALRSHGLASVKVAESLVGAIATLSSFSSIGNEMAGREIVLLMSEVHNLHAESSDSLSLSCQSFHTKMRQYFGPEVEARMRETLAARAAVRSSSVIQETPSSADSVTE